jgi:hypothetical protein
MMSEEFLWKLSNDTALTAPLIFDEIFLQESPTKSGTKNSFSHSS